MTRKTHILACCAFCGDVTLRPDEVVITDYGTRHAFEFDCPVCEIPVSREANQRVIEVLTAVGVEIVPAVPLPSQIVDMLAALRAHASYDVETEFKYQLAAVDTLSDIGWEMSE